MEALVAKGVTKRYTEHVALDNVTLTIPEKSIYGLLGPNGAGKTTLIRIVNQIINSDAGEISIFGEKLAEKGISAEIINIHTIKPLDNEAILKSLKKTKCVVTAEEHQMNGGLGDSVAQLLSRHLPSPQEFVAVNDSFGESGTPDQLMTKYGLDTINIIEAVERVMKRK